MKKHSRDGVNTRKLGSFLALLSFTAYMPVSCLPAFAEIGANVLPDLNKAVNGDVTTNANKMNVAVKGGQGAVGQFDWNSFNVGKNATVNFQFSANSQTALNRVLATGGMSQIYGKLTQSSGVSGCAACANTGKVILINPAGIMFGNGSSVNLNSFTASTFDIKGAKNLQDLKTQTALDNYVNGTATAPSLMSIAGAEAKVEFVPNNNMVNGNGELVVNAPAGSKLASIIAEGSDIYGDKTVAMVGNKINVKDSKITTRFDKQLNAENGTQMRSNVKLVTSDGVNFYYTSAGNIDNLATGPDGGARTSYGSMTTTSKTKGIDVEGSEIRTGNLDVVNMYNGANSDINIKKSVVYSKKMLGSNTDGKTAEQTGTNGNIAIQSAGKVNIDESNIQTVNEEGLTTVNMGLGNLRVAAYEDVNIKNSILRTADSKKNTDSSNITAGNIKISSGSGDINITQDKTIANVPTLKNLVGPDDKPFNYDNIAIASSGDLSLSAANDVNVKGYDKLQAVGQSNVSTNRDRSINITAKNVNIDNTKVVNAKNLNVKATDKIDITKSAVVANNTKLWGANTTVDNASLQYQNISFYDKSATKKNNVTLKGQDLAIEDTTSGLTISTNGNLTVDNTNLNKRAYGSTTVKDKKFVTLESTEGNVTIQNGANVKSNAGDINVKANGNVAVNSSSVWAKDGNVNVSAKTGKITAKGSSSSSQASIVAEGGSAKLEQGKDMNLNSDFKNSLVGGTTKLTLKSNGSVIGENLVNGSENIGSHKSVKTLKDTTNNARFTLTKDAEIIAGDNISLKGAGNLTLDNLTTDSGKGTLIAAPNGDLALNDLNIKNGPTTLEGKTVKTPSGKIKANENKVAINAPGDIDINISGASNPDNGLEINANISTGIYNPKTGKNDNNYSQDDLKGRNVKVNAGDETLAISKIKADTLDVKAGKIVKGKTEITNKWDNLGYVGDDGKTHQEIADSKDAKGYIEVRTEGKFNLDPTDTYNDANKGIYTGGHFSTTTNTTTKDIGDAYSKSVDKVVDTKVTTDSEKIGSKTVKGEEIGRSEASRTPSGEPKVTTERIDNVYQDGQQGYTTVTTTVQEYDVVDNVTYKTTTTDTYKDTQTTTTTTQTTTTTYQDYKTTTGKTDKQHIATLNDSEKDGFVLVYGKGSTTSKTGTKVIDTKTTEKTDTKTIVTNPAREVVTTGTVKDKETRKDVKTTKNSVFCAYEKPVTPDAEVDVDIDDFSTWVKLPRHSEGVSNSAPVQNDLADTTSSVVAAAARLQLDDTDEDGDEYLE